LIVPVVFWMKYLVDQAQVVFAGRAGALAVDLDHRHAGRQGADGRRPEGVHLARREHDQVAALGDQVAHVADLLGGVAIGDGVGVVVLRGPVSGPLILHALGLGEAPGVVQLALREADEIFRLLGRMRGGDEGVALGGGHDRHGIDGVEDAGGRGGAEAQPGGAAEEVEPVDLAGAKLGSQFIQVAHMLILTLAYDDTTTLLVPQACGRIVFARCTGLLGLISTPFPRRHGTAAGRRLVKSFL
jgi:hypothetical protein